MIVNFKPGEYMRNDYVITFSDTVDTGGLEETPIRSSWNLLNHPCHLIPEVFLEINFVCALELAFS